MKQSIIDFEIGCISKWRVTNSVTNDEFRITVIFCEFLEILAHCLLLIPFELFEALWIPPEKYQIPASKSQSDNSS